MPIAAPVRSAVAGAPLAGAPRVPGMGAIPSPVPIAVPGVVALAPLAPAASLASLPATIPVVPLAPLAPPPSSVSRAPLTPVTPMLATRSARRGDEDSPCGSDSSHDRRRYADELQNPIATTTNG